MKARTEQLIVEEVGEECIVYIMDSQKAHCLNKPLKWIWQQCDGDKTPEQIATEFQRNFHSADPVADVDAGLRQLASAALLTGEIPEAVARDPGITRRSMVGAGSLAIPLLTSILAPFPAAAKSKDKDPKDKDKEPKEPKGGKPK